MELIPVQSTCHLSSLISPPPGILLDSSSQLCCNVAKSPKEQHRFEVSQLCVACRSPCRARSLRFVPQRAMSDAGSILAAVELEAGPLCTCKWCLRTNRSENPIREQREDKPFLQFRRERGAECNVCPRFLKHHKIGVDKNSYLKKLEDAGERKQFMEQLAEFEYQLNFGAPLKRRRRG